MVKKESAVNEFMQAFLDGFPCKSDEEINEMATQEWIGVLTQLWDAVGKPVNNKQLAVYVKQLGDIPMGALEKTVALLLREHQFSNVPTIGEIWKAFRELYRDVDQAYQDMSKDWVWQFEADKETA